MEISHENHDALVNLCRIKVPQSNSWPRRWDECWIPVNALLFTTEDFVTITGQPYKLDAKSD